jgi:hypothetical protein
MVRSYEQLGAMLSVCQEIKDLVKNSFPIANEISFNGERLAKAPPHRLKIISCTCLSW